MEGSKYHKNISTFFHFQSSQTSYLEKLIADVISHPYPPVPTGLKIGQKFFEQTIRPEVPFGMVLGYLAFFAFLNRRQDGKDRMKGPWWRALLLLHNVLLAAYSLWTFVGTGPATIAYFIRGYKAAGVPGLVHNFCDSSMSLWDGVISPYSYLFYLSKFWEILDTVILIGKGKRASLLQEYHHAGAILTVWAGVRYESPAAWLFIVFNSLVHTIMYTYYALSVLHISVPGVLKRSLTKIQIAQFVLGGSLGALTLLLSLPKEVGDSFEWEPIKAVEGEGLERLGPGFNENFCLHTPGQRLTVLGGVGYLIPLTGLFLSFYFQSYRRKIDSKKQQSRHHNQATKDKALKGILKQDKQKN
ncbi:GNS1/SUR4 family-domain-containing protein [Phakopsora pachyrhizi]|uniref:Elongation of fatty acids protein n=1 Tax=Phakopsora pachyrhizi TaxID=170000 RepID=A0AAV0B9C3_PHAPC|nr:GNS1/SUR4 family-domain-containing protein [Phakopsora pachyrhizi]CAH7682691.1 GNS1/SUR4 family-domain-containing protein [Phakopsora pachyrhizi]